MSDWISVKDRLPDVDGEYIVFRPPENTFGDIVIRTFRGGEFSGLFEVTHWMPLPPAPEEE